MAALFSLMMSMSIHLDFSCTLGYFETFCFYFSKLSWSGPSLHQLKMSHLSILAHFRELSTIMAGGVGSGWNRRHEIFWRTWWWPQNIWRFTQGEAGKTFWDILPSNCTSVCVMEGGVQKLFTCSGGWGNILHMCSRWDCEHLEYLRKFLPTLPYAVIVDN